MIAIQHNSLPFINPKNEIITLEMSEIKLMIAQTVTQRNVLKNQMQNWYNEHPREHFLSMQDLILVDATLSKLDSFYKRLWDYNNLSKPA